MIYSIVNSNLFCFMKRNFFIFPLLITSWFLNSGFLFKPNIKVMTCGNGDYISSIKLEDEKEILGNYPWIFDSKSGQLYAYDQKKNTLKPVKREIIDNYEYIYLENYIKGSILYIESIDRDLETNQSFNVKTILDFEKFKLTTIYEGEEPYNDLCKEIGLPKDIKILK